MRSLVVLAALSLLVLVPAASAVVPSVVFIGPHPDGAGHECTDVFASTNHVGACAGADAACPVSVVVNDVRTC